MGWVIILYEIIIKAGASERLRKSSSFHFFFVHFFLILSSSILILLIFGDEIVHVGFGFSEFHLVHALTGVPMEEGLSSEHSSELFTDSLEHLLNGGGVSEEGNGHLETLGWDIAD